jgi:hypothetical protein
MAAQLDYEYSTPKGAAGGKFDISFDEVVTRNNEEADGVLKYGMAAMIGTAVGSGVKLPVAGATAKQIEGIVLRAANTEQDMTGAVVVKKGASVGIMRKGHIWARTATGATVTYGAAAYVVLTGADAGKFTDSSEDTLDIGAKFGNASDDGIAVIEINK